MKELIVILDELLEAYETATPSIDQDLVDKVLEAREAARRLI